MQLLSWLSRWLVAYKTLTLLNIFTVIVHNECKAHSSDLSPSGKINNLFQLTSTDGMLSCLMTLTVSWCLSCLNVGLVPWYLVPASSRQDCVWPYRVQCCIVYASRDIVVSEHLTSLADNCFPGKGCSHYAGRISKSNSSQWFKKAFHACLAGTDTSKRVQTSKKLRHHRLHTHLSACCSTECQLMEELQQAVSLNQGLQSWQAKSNSKDSSLALIFI